MNRIAHKAASRSSSLFLTNFRCVHTQNKDKDKLYIPPIPTVKDVIKIYKLRARKQLSQNFLLNPPVLRKFVNQAGNIEGSHVCEVGPGPGGITRTILEAGAEHLSVIEKDGRFMPSLQELNELTGNRMSLYYGDVLRFDTSEIFPIEMKKDWFEAPPNLYFMGNLPFNVSIPLIIQWLECISTQTGAWSRGRVPCLLTFQKEVAERMVASIYNEQRSRLSVTTQYLCHVDIKFTIPGTAFLPPPDVDVAVVHFVPRVEPLIKLPFKLVNKVVRHVFQFRQKHCKHGLMTLFPRNRVDLLKRLVEDAQIDPTSPAHKLTIDEFNELCIAYNSICEEEQDIYDYNFIDHIQERNTDRTTLPF